MFAINDGGQFGRTNAEIYLKEFEVIPEHQGTHTSFLNLDVNIVDGKFEYTLYDKKDSFPFFIAKMSHTDSNIFYSTFVGEIFMMARSIHTPFIFSQNFLNWY